VSEAIAGALKDAAEDLGKSLGEDATKAVHDLYEDTGSKLEQVAEHSVTTDAENAKLFSGLHEGDDGLPAGHGGSGGGHGSDDGGHGFGDDGATPGEGGAHPGEDEPPTLRNGSGDERGSAQDGDDMTTDGDPVDVASGRMVMKQIDAEFAAALPLTLSRTHLSTYRAGRLFGPSWASTLDERLELDDDGICYASEGGAILVYPVPRPGVPVLPSEGPRLPLVYRPDLGGTITITDPSTGACRSFAPLPDIGLHNSGVAILPIREIRDRNDNHIVFEYDDAGTPRGIRHSGGYRLAVETDGGRVTCLRLLGDTSGYQSALADEAEGLPLVRYGYDEHGDLVEVYNSSGEPLRLDYDDRHRVVAWTERTGTGYRYTYDSLGRVARGEGTDGRLNASFAYDPLNATTTVTDSLGRQTRYELNSLRQVVRVVDAAGHATASEWDRYDRLISRTDPLGNSTRFDYDEAGNLTLVTRADGSTIAATYNDFCQPVTVTGPDGARWEHAYDERGNLIAVTDPTGATTRAAAGPTGAPAAITDPLGRVTTIATDAAGLPVRVTAPGGAVTAYTRDAFGRTTAITEPDGAVTRLATTVEGELTRRQHPDGAVEEWSYDAEGNLLTHRNAVGGLTAFEYGSFDLPSARVTPDGVRLEFTHDTELRLTSVTNPAGESWSYAYDTTGHLVAETDFNGRTLSYRLDAAGRMTRRVNGAGEAVVFTRDVFGRIIEQRAGDDVTSFTYDANGRLVAARNAEVEMRLRRDPLGRVLSESLNGRSVESVYDAAGYRVRRATPAGVVSDWSYDADGRPSTLRAGARRLDFRYDAIGLEAARRLDSGLELTRGWDARRRVTALSLATPRDATAENTAEPGNTAAPGSTAAPDAATGRMLRRSYAYRADGSPERIDDLATGSRAYELDAAGRVTAVRAADWQESYAYDAAGNLLRAELPAEVGGDSAGEREVAGTLVRRAGRTSYEYDGQGRVVRRIRRLLTGGRRVWSYEWNSDDRLVATTTPEGERWRYAYDPLGRRVSKQRVDEHGEVLERVLFAWDGQTLAEQSRAEAHAIERITAWDYAPDTGEPIVQRDSRGASDGNAGDGNAGGDEAVGGTAGERLPQHVVDERFHAIVTDLVGTPTELVDPEGAIAWRSVSTLWGVPLGASRSNQGVECPLRFPGQYEDPETGWFYNYQRHYDPETARYATPDPLGLAPALNQHGYVDNPLVTFDPLGLAPSPGGGVDASANSVHGHIAAVTIRRADGSIRLQYGVFSGRTTPEEGTLGTGYNAQAVTHTEHRISRLSGASTGPKISIPNDPYFNQIPVQSGESVEIQAVLPPCKRCQGAMNRMRKELGTNVTYSWDGPKGAGTWP
jgi:RHS repeat-associated protein